MTAKYVVRAYGCHDATEIVVELTDAERDAVAKVAGLITAASRSECNPKLGVRTATAEDIEEQENDDDDD